MLPKQPTLKGRQQINQFLFQAVNSNRLIVFRMLFGLIMAIECLGSVATNRVNELFVDTPFNFPFIGFQWLSFLHGHWMNYYYVAMAIASLMVSVGFFYRLSAFSLAIMWTMVYFAEKTHYNNHYYLMVLLTWVMALMPANRRASVDAWNGRVKKSNSIYRWQHYLFVGQIAIMYAFAGIAKLNPDWLRAMPLKLWLHSFATLPLIGRFFQDESAAWVMAYFGLFFDLLIVPGLLWKPTRKATFIAAVFFHCSNSLLFGIGTFPYLAIALCIFFASARWLEEKILRTREFELTPLNIPPAYQRSWIVSLVALYFSLQMVLPIRHWFIPGDVNWTEEGHRMAWRMMLRSKSGGIMFRVKNAQTGKEWQDFPNQLLSSEQFNDLITHPDIIWQYAQHLKQKYQAQGIVAEVYAEGCCSLNGKPCRPLVDPTIDLAASSWNAFGHNPWVVRYD